MDKDRQEMMRRQSEELMMRNLELTLLHEIADVTSREMDLHKMLCLVLEKIVDLPIFEIDVEGGIFVVEDKGLKLESQVGLPQQFAQEHTGKRPGQCLCASAMKTGRIVIPATDSQEASKHHFDMRATAGREQMAVPFKIANRVVGVLFLYSPAGLKIDDRRVGLFESIGSLVGAAIENARLFAKTRELALHDPLTGLANRNLMQEVLDNNLARARRTGKRFCVAMLDLDRFKEVNDSYGHKVGDKLLVEIAGIIQNETRAMDLAVRYGGEEFLLILAETGLQGGLEVGERIRREIEAMDTYCIAGRPACIITTSIGVASYDAEVTGSEDMLARADQALYLAKRKGGNRVEGWQDGPSTMAI